MAQIIFIITGSIAAPKALELYDHIKSKHEINLIVTNGAKKFLPSLPPEAITAEKAYEFHKQTHLSFHTEINKQNDFLLVYPASQNFIAKVAHGFSDDLTSLIWSANNHYKMVFPTMNTNMYTNPATVRNIELLQKSGVDVLEPKIGKLACNTNGIGRAWEWQDVDAYIENYLQLQNKLKNTKVMLSFGKTRTYIDDIRYITNHASGKMGKALYDVFKQTSAHLTAISGDVENKIFQTLQVKTNQEMLTVMSQHFDKQDIVINLAALNDFQIINPQKGKIDKRQQQKFNLEFAPNLDVLYELGKRKKNQLLIGFSAQQDVNNIKKAHQKMINKNLDAIVINDINVMGQDKTSVLFLTKENNQVNFKGTKQFVAKKIVLEIIKLYQTKIIKTTDKNIKI